MLATKDTWARAAARGLVPSRRDLLLLAYLPSMAALAWSMPTTVWMPLCIQAARLSGRAGKRRAENTRRIAEVFAPEHSARIAAGIGAHHHHARLQLLRCYRSPAWRPPITLAGRAYLDAALAAGSGAVLWVAPFVYGNLITKMAFFDAGIRLAHLSGPQHGVSTSLFGQRFLNPIWTNIEGRFLSERVIMTTAEASGALRQLLRRVKANNPISITMGPHGARRHTPAFLRGRLILANGAPSLACRSGAPLLPVLTVRGDDGCWVTTIEAPAPVGRDDESGIADYCARVLESYVRRWPDQFDGWSMTER